MERYVISVGKKEYDVSNMVELSKEINAQYNRLLNIIYEISNDKFNPHKYKNTYRNVKEKIIGAYSSYALNAEKEFNVVYRDLEHYLTDKAPNISFINNRTKTLESTLKKIALYHLGFFEPGKSPFISDLFGIRIVVPNNNIAEIACKYVNELVIGSENLTYYLETPLIKEKNDSRKYRGVEVIFSRGNHTIRWKGVVVENLQREDDKVYVNLLIGVPLSYYKDMKRILKGIARKVKENKSCEELKETCEYVITDKNIREVFRTSKLFTRYDVNNGVLTMIIPSTSIMEYYSKLIEKISLSHDISSKDMLKKGIILRPHYGLEKFEIPYLFEKMGFEIKEYFPWERLDPPKDIIINANEAYFYSSKIGYYHERESTPLLEIQVMDEKQYSFFTYNPQYKHDVYVNKKNDKAYYLIKSLSSLATHKKRSKNIYNFLKSMYKELTSL